MNDKENEKKTGDDYRESAAERGRKWRRKQIKDGKKFLNLIVSPECHQRLTEEREATGRSFSEIVEGLAMESLGPGRKGER